MAASLISEKEFRKLYNDFDGSDQEFAEFLNKKFKTNLNAAAIYIRRKRLGIKTKNPKKIGDTAAFKKFIQGFKGKEIYKGFVADNAKKFGIDRGTASRIIDEVRPDIKDLPYKPDKETLRKEAVKKKNINYLDDKGFKKELRKFKPVVTGSDAEFAKYLNEKGFKAFGNIPFTGEAVGNRRLKLGLESKNITTRGKVFSDEDILKQAKEMKLDIRGKKADEIRQAVINSRDLEKGRSPEDIKKLRDFRERRVLMAGKERIFPVTIGKDATPKDLFWRDLIDNAQRHQSYLKNRPGPILAESHIKFLNPNEGRPTDTKGFKKIKLVDTNVIGKQNKPMTLTYDNFLNHLDKNSKMYGIDSKTAMEEYKKKRFIQKNPELRNEFNLKLNSRYDPTSATKRAVFSPFHIHHTAGRGQNAFNVQFAVGTENMAENAFRRTFDKEFKAANTLTDKKAAVKKYLNAVPENLEVRLKKTPYGTRETLVEMTQRVAPELTNKLTTAVQTLISKTENLSKADQLRFCSLLSSGGLPGDCKRALEANPEKAAQVLSDAPATNKAAAEVKDSAQKLIRLYRGEGFNLRTGPTIKEMAKTFGVSEAEAKKKLLSGQWFTSDPVAAASYTNKLGKTKFVDVTPKEFMDFKKYVERVNKTKSLSGGERFAVGTGDKLSIVPRYKLDEFEKANRLKSQRNIFKDFTTKSGFMERAEGVLSYDSVKGGFVDPADPTTIVNQDQIKAWAEANPEKVTAGTEAVEAATNKSVISNVAKSLARVGAPLPVAAIDSYFIGKQVADGKGTAEIASNPLNWLGLATMEPLAKASGIAEPGKLNAILRLGLNPATIRGITRFAGLPGLAISTAMTAYDQYQKYKDGEGFIFNLLNQKGTE